MEPELSLPADHAKAAEQPSLLSVLASVLLDPASWQPGPTQLAVAAIRAATTDSGAREHYAAQRALWIEPGDRP
jgi:hypothetical protein